MSVVFQVSSGSLFHISKSDLRLYSWGGMGQCKCPLKGNASVFFLRLTSLNKKVSFGNILYISATNQQERPLCIYSCNHHWLEKVKADWRPEFHLFSLMICSSSRSSMKMRKLSLGTLGAPDFEVSRMPYGLTETRLQWLRRCLFVWDTINTWYIRMMTSDRKPLNLLWLITPAVSQFILKSCRTSTQIRAKQLLQTTCSVTVEASHGIRGGGRVKDVNSWRHL